MKQDDRVTIGGVEYVVESIGERAQSTAASMERVRRGIARYLADRERVLRDDDGNVMFSRAKGGR